MCRCHVFTVSIIITCQQGRVTWSQHGDPSSSCLLQLIIGCSRRGDVLPRIRMDYWRSAVFKPDCSLPCGMLKATCKPDPLDARWQVFLQQVCELLRQQVNFTQNPPLQDAHNIRCSQ